MRYKQIGDTNAKISEIGFGTSNYNGDIATLRHALSMGINFIDTAESYGTESIIGNAIKGLRNQVFLATKVSPVNFRYKNILAAAEGSLKRLQTDYIDLYQLHWPNYTVSLEETLSAVARLVETGKVRFIGVSNFCSAYLQRALLALSAHKVVADQVRYSLIERTIESSLLPYCSKEHVSVLAFSPLGGAPEKLRQADPNDVLGKIAAEVGKTRAQVALQWCVSKSIVIAIVKADSILHVTENCELDDWDLSPEQMKILNTGIKFRRRNNFETALRQIAQRCLQKTGRSLGSPAITLARNDC